MASEQRQLQVLPMCSASVTTCYVLAANIQQQYTQVFGLDTVCVHVYCYYLSGKVHFLTGKVINSKSVNDLPLSVGSDGDRAGVDKISWNSILGAI